MSKLTKHLAVAAMLAAGTWTGSQAYADLDVKLLFSNGTSSGSVNAGDSVTLNIVVDVSNTAGSQAALQNLLGYISIDAAGLGLFTGATVDAVAFTGPLTQAGYAAGAPVGATWGDTTIAKAWAVQGGWASGSTAPTGVAFAVGTGLTIGSVTFTADAAATGSAVLSFNLRLPNTSAYPSASWYDNTSVAMGSTNIDGGVVNFTNATLTFGGQVGGPASWTGSGANANWSTAGNWVNPPANPATDSITFGAVTNTAVDVDGTYTVGDVSFTGGTYTLSGTGGLVVEKTGGATIAVTGSQTISAAGGVVLNSATTINGGGTLTVSSIGGAGALTLDGTNLTVDAVGSTPLVLTDLDLTGASVLDPGARDVIIKFTGDNPYTTVQGWVLDGIFGTEGVAKIASSTSEADMKYHYIIDNSVLAAMDAAFPEWNGVTLSGNELLLIYTYLGDVNFDGMVNADDYGFLDNLTAEGYYDLSAGWFFGDINFDGMVNADDYGFLDNLTADGYYAPSLVATAAVPEPATLSVLALGGMGLLLRRRTKR